MLRNYKKVVSRDKDIYVLIEAILNFSYVDKNVGNYSIDKAFCGVVSFLNIAARIGF